MQSRNSRVGESKRYLSGFLVRNTLEDSGSKDLSRERVPLDRNLSASECSVMPRAQNNLSRRL